MINCVIRFDCIVNIFKNKFKNVYNSNVTDISELPSLENDIEQHIMFCSSPTDYVITVKQVNLAKDISDGNTVMLTDNIVHVNSPQICSGTWIFTRRIVKSSNCVYT